MASFRRRLAALVCAACAAALSSSSVARADEPQGPSRSGGLIPGVRIAPKLALVGIPPGFGAEARFLDDAWGAALDVGLIPRTATGDILAAGWTDVRLSGQFYPWRERLYLGLGLGYRSITLKVKDSQTNLPLGGEVAAIYLAPEVGWRFRWADGFFLGIDLGWQIVVSSSKSVEIAPSTTPGKAQDARDLADTLASSGFPVLTLLQLGWYF